MRITRTDVAKMAGVSKTTVSNVVNNKKNVSEDVRSKIMSIINELNYKPNLIARSLITNNTNQLAFVIGDVLDPHFSAYIAAFENTAMKNGYFVNICIGNHNPRQLFDSFISRMIEGVLLMVSPTNFDLDLIDGLVKDGVKVVATFSYDQNTSPKGYSILETDYDDAMKKIIKYLISFGHKDIALLSIFDEHFIYDTRLAAFKKYMTTYLNDSDPSIILGRNPYPAHIDTGKQMTNDLFSTGKKFTSIICGNDLLAIGCIEQLKVLGLRVPEDVSVVGTGDIMFSQYTTPPLTTMSMDIKKFGETAFDMLHNSIIAGQTSRKIVKLSIEERGSVAKAKI